METRDQRRLETLTAEFAAADREELIEDARSDEKLEWWSEEELAAIARLGEEFI